MLINNIGSCGHQRFRGVRVRDFEYLMGEPQTANYICTIWPQIWMSWLGPQAFPLAECWGSRNKYIVRWSHIVVSLSLEHKPQFPQCAKKGMYICMYSYSLFWLNTHAVHAALLYVPWIKYTLTLGQIFKSLSSVPGAFLNFSCDCVDFSLKNLDMKHQ
jgi:hypothetical protein